MPQGAEIRLYFACVYSMMPYGVNFLPVKEDNDKIIFERNDVKMVRQIRSVKPEDSISNLKLTNRLQLNTKKLNVCKMEFSHGLVILEG